MNKGSKYTSVLRVWEPLPGDDRKYDEILDLCKKHPNAFDSVLFFTQNNYSVRNPETHRATAQYRIYAELHPDRIYIDDDISSMSCFCPACIRRFAREYGVLDEPCATRTAA